MTDSRLVDGNGCLLPPEQCNITLLHCLTKERARNPNSRLPSALQNVKEKINIHKQQHIQDKEVKYEAKDTIELDRKPVRSVVKEIDRSNRQETGKTRRFKNMKCNEDDDVELSEKPIREWSTDEVCLWLDYVNLSKLKDNFKDQNVNGQTLVDLKYETLEKLQLSSASDEREQFLGAVYELQQEHELEMSMQDIKEHEEVVKPVNNSEVTSEDKSPTTSTNTNSGTSDQNTMVTEKQDTITGQNKPVKTAAKQPSPSREAKKPLKQGEKKRKSGGKRIKRFWNSFHGNKSVTDADGSSGPFYKNVFHDLMEAGPQGIIKIWTEMFLTDMQYVSLLVRRETTAYETIKMVLEKSNAHEDPDAYRICEINERGNECILDKDECPLQRERRWSDPDHCRFELRWSNERLIEWDQKPAVGDVSFERVSDEKTTPSSINQSRDAMVEDNTEKAPHQNNMDLNIDHSDGGLHHPGAAGDGDSSDEISPDATTANGVLETSDSSVENVTQTDMTPDEPGSLLRAHKNKFTSSCPDLTSDELFNGNRLEVSSLSDKSGEDTGVDDYSTTFDDELKYSQRLRTSSKNLSGRLKLTAESAQPEAVNRDNGGHSGNMVNGIDGDKLEEITKISNDELQSTPVDQGGVNGSLGDMAGSEVITCDKSEKMELLSERVEELENENAGLVEENRELKMSCRTFEGKSRLKERELQEMALEKDEIAMQMQETVDDLHKLRSENAELRAGLSEANTKLGDVDGWVTRETFEDIRGQLSLSLEEIEQRDKAVEELTKKCSVLGTENKKIETLGNEIEELKTKIKETEKCLKEKEIENHEKKTKIEGFETQVTKLRSSVKKRDEEKESLVKLLEETQQGLEDEKNKNINNRKDLQKKVSDKEYEILIMKEEKKELCLKLKSLENNIETIQEEMKQKESEHEMILAEMKEQSDIKDQSLSVTVINLEELVTERDNRIKQLKKQLAEVSQNDIKAKEHEYEQNKLYLKHLVALVKKKEPKLLDQLNKTLKSKYGSFVP